MLADPEWTALLAEREIRNVLYRYCRAIDRRDPELLRVVYHDDAFDDHGPRFRGGPDEFVAWVMPHLRDNFVRTMHRLHNILIELDGDSARVETYCVADHIRRGEDNKPSLSTFVLRYIDRFERRPGAGWRIAHRIVVKEWRADSVLKPGAWADEGFVGSRADREDVVYAESLLRREHITPRDETDAASRSGR